MARNKGPSKVQQCGVAGSSFLDDHAFRKPLARTFVATTAQTFVRRRANARPASTNTPRHEHHLTECQQNRVNIPGLRLPLTRNPSDRVLGG